MLYEIRKPRQIPGESLRRWFFSHEQDLYVWYDKAGLIIAFQLCYAKQQSEHALYWRNDRGYAHLRVDNRWRHCTPLLVADGSFDRDAVLDRFRLLSRQLPADVVSFVDTRLSSYPNGADTESWWKLSSAQSPRHSGDSEPD